MRTRSTADPVDAINVEQRGVAHRDPVAVAAMVDRLVHHADVIALKGESYRLKGRVKEVMSAAEGP